MTAKKKPLSNVELWDVITYEAAMVSAENYTEPQTLDEKLAIDRLQKRSQALIHRLRQEAFATIEASKPEPKRPPIPERLLAMSRDALIAQWHALDAQRPAETYFRKVEDMTIEELRTWVWDMEISREKRR